MAKLSKTENYRIALIGRYQAELTENQEKLKHIQKFLKKLTPVKSKKGLIKKDTPKVTKPVQGKTSTRKAKYAPRIKGLPWEQFLTTRMKSTKRLYSPSDLAVFGLTTYKLPATSKYKVRDFLMQILEGSGKFKAHFPAGSKRGYYGLSEWFDGSNLKKVFKNRF